MTIRQKLISAFIIFNAMTIVYTPVKTFREQNSLQALFYPYALWTRLLQKWNLFTPEPRRYASYYQVEVMFEDNTSTTWKRPYPDNWSFFNRHLCYNWQKYDLAVTHMEYEFFWDDIINFIAHQDFVTKPISRIRLSKMQAPWPAPKKEGYTFTDIKDLNWQDVTLFVYDYKAKKYL